MSASRLNMWGARVMLFRLTFSQLLLLQWWGTVALWPKTSSVKLQGLGCPCPDSRYCTVIVSGVPIGCGRLAVAFWHDT